MDGIYVQYFLICHEVQQDEQDNITFCKVFDNYSIEESPSKITFSVVVGIHHNNLEEKKLKLELMDKRKRTLTNSPFEIPLQEGENFTIATYVLQKVPVKKGKYHAFLSIDKEIIAKLQFTVDVKEGEQDEHNGCEKSGV